MNAINFARSFGLTYLHKPFSSIHHAERPMEEWVAAWEGLFNLGAGEAICSVGKREVVDFCYNYMELDLCFGWRSRGDELADRFKAMIPELRRKYHLNKTRSATDEVTVAVHVRRGDVSANSGDYFTSNETIRRTITAAKSILDALKVNHRIRLYSQGVSGDFADLSLPCVELFLNVDAVWTMQELIEADVLVMAKGCFSYCAGLISDGIKIFEPEGWSDLDHLPGWKWRAVPPSERWIPCGADGSFNAKAFERQLLVIIRAKATARSHDGEAL